MSGDNNGTGPWWLLVLFILIFFGTLAGLVYASFNGFAPKVASAGISIMLASTPLWFKYCRPQIPTYQAVLVALAFIVMEVVAHKIGEHFPPAFFLSHVVLDLLVGGSVFGIWKKYR